MTFSDYAIALSIGFLYPYFFNRLANILSQEHEIKQEYCYGKDYTDEQIEECNKNREINLNNARNKKFIIMIIGGFVAIILSYICSNNKTLAAGFGLAGTISNITAIIMMWSAFNDNIRLGIIGMSIVLLIILSLYRSKLKNIIIQ